MADDNPHNPPDSAASELKPGIPPEPAASANGPVSPPPDGVTGQLAPGGVRDTGIKVPEATTTATKTQPGNGPLSTPSGVALPSKKGAGASVGPMRELLETVVFVVVLVLLLKTFVAEAFVIPTGSMADTLLGYNKEVTCPKCGVTFPVNCSEEVEKKTTGRPLTKCTCFNCRYRIDFDAEEEAKKADPIYPWRKPQTSSGDRVLVAKANNDLFTPYKPLDVVVFKYPEKPQENFVATNFIKRLIGLPEQVIGIYYGDIYVAEKADVLKALARKGLSLDPTDFEQGIDVRKRVYKDRFKELLEEGDPCFRLLRKPPAKADAMKRPVYDADHPATDLKAEGFPDRWAPEMDNADADEFTAKAYRAKRARAARDPGAWKPDKMNGFTCPGRADQKTAWVRYRHILRAYLRYNDREQEWDEEPNSQQEARLIEDFLSYNSGNSSNEKRVGGNRWVGDLLLECEVKVEKAEGELILELSKGVDRFRARWQLQTGQCTLLRNGKELATKSTRINKPGTYRVRFANFDRRLTVWVDRGLPFENGVDYEAPQRRDSDGKIHFLHGPSAKNDLEPASIGYSGGAVLGIHKIKLWRDTYYLSNEEPGSDSVPDAVFSDPSRWEGEYTLAGLTMYVQAGHYLCLGDNSPASSDSRVWGLVPDRLMLGRAMVIYYPFYFPYPPFRSDVNRVRTIE
jgi:signal peptidase I